MRATGLHLGGMIKKGLYLIFLSEVSSFSSAYLECLQWYGSELQCLFRSLISHWCLASFPCVFRVADAEYLVTADSVK